MRLDFKQYLRLPYVIIICALCLVFVVDFIQRVWRPLDTQDLTVTKPFEAVAPSKSALELPVYLTQWLETPEQGSDTANVVDDASNTEQIVAIPGSIQFADENIRIRAIFISNNANKNARGNVSQQAIALAEVQNIETGKLTRRALIKGDMLSTWEVISINANMVLLAKAEASDVLPPQHIELYVFEPINNAQTKPSNQ